MKTTAASFRPPHQRGVASLAIVAILFFVMALVAAYANRNLIFEQRTSANQYRYTQAFEAAEAGAEWVLAMLNAGRIDANCQPSDDVANSSFRQRYLAIDDTTGNITAAAPDGAGMGTVWPSCVFDGDQWDCSCPAAGAPALDAPAGDGPFPAFRVRLSRPDNVQPGLLLVEVNGCSRLADTCLDFPAASLASEGRATVYMVAALRSALPLLPAAALTVRGSVDLDGAALGVYNSEPLTPGISILAGGPIDTTGLRLGSVGGTPGEQSVRPDDAELAALSVDRLFQSTFAARVSTFRGQPGLVALGDCGGSCTAAAIREAVVLNPGRILWIDGDIDFDDDDAIGSADEPVLIVAAGNVQFSGTAQVHGLLYSRAEDWASAGAGEVRGAVIAEGNLQGNATTTIVYDRTVLQNLQWRTGSFVRVPGGWSDFKDN